MSYGLKARIRNAALADASLLTLLGTASPASLRWYDTQLPQGSSFPAMVVQVISNPKVYTNAGRLRTSFARVQFTAWADQTSGGATALGLIEQAMQTFLDGLDLVGIPGLVQYSNQIVGKRDGFYAQTQPAKFWLVLDVKMFWNDSISS
jgi:hypothetical protein